MLTNKFSLYIVCVLFSTLCFNSCKKGCTDPLAFNYNSNRTEDNGSCRYYDLVFLDSIRINRISEVDQIGYGWDAGDTLDVDNDFTFPDLYVTVLTPSGYLYNSTSYWSDINPNYCDVLMDFSGQISSSQWEQNGFIIYLYDYEYDNTIQFIDSVFVNPYNYNATSKSQRFKTSISTDYNIEGIGVDVYFDWKE